MRNVENTAILKGSEECRIIRDSRYVRGRWQMWEMLADARKCGRMRNIKEGRHNANVRNVNGEG